MKSLLTTRLTSLEQMGPFVKDVLALLPPQAIVLLSGDLGAGKTTFVLHCCRELGISNAQSPTYSIHNRYPGVDHFDLYRLESRDQLESAGFFDLLEDSRGLCFIEWPERLSSGDLPLHRKTFELTFTLQNDGRNIVLRAMN